LALGSTTSRQPPAAGPDDRDFSGDESDNCGGLPMIWNEPGGDHSGDAAQWKSDVIAVHDCSV